MTTPNNPIGTIRELVEFYNQYAPVSADKARKDRTMTPTPQDIQDRDLLMAIVAATGEGK